MPSLRTSMGACWAKVSRGRRILCAWASTRRRRPCARRGIRRAVAQASDGRGTATSLCQAACAYFNVAAPDDLSMAIYAPSMTNERIAGFGRCVVEAAQKKDPVAREIIGDAGRELGKAAAAVI